MKGLSAAFAAKQRRERASSLVTAWMGSDQAVRIKTELGPIVLGACRWEVEAIASKRNSDERGAVILTKAQVKLCEERAVSQARVASQGPWAIDQSARDRGARWKRETASARAMVLKGIHPPRIGDLVTADLGAKDEPAQRTSSEASSQ